MKRYLVGGAVRDRLRGVTVQDRDYVLVGAGQEDIGSPYHDTKLQLHW